MKVLIYTTGDLDGAGSAILVKLYLRKFNPEVVNIEYANARDISSKIAALVFAEQQYDRIYICNISIPKENIIGIDIPNIQVFDRHIEHKAIANNYCKTQPVIIPYTSCTKLLSDKVFAKHIELTSEQKELVEIIDSYERQQLTSSAIDYNAILYNFDNFKSSFISKFVDGFIDGTREFTQFERNAITLYKKRFKHTIEVASTTTHKGTIKNFSVIAVFANDCIDSVSTYFINKFKVDACILIDVDNNKVYFKRSALSSSNSFNMGKLAEALCEGSGTAKFATGKLTPQFANLTNRFKPC